MTYKYPWWVGPPMINQFPCYPNYPYMKPGCDIRCDEHRSSDTEGLKPVYPVSGAINGNLFMVDDGIPFIFDSTRRPKLSKSIIVSKPELSYKNGSSIFFLFHKEHKEFVLFF